ncbi:hypothetical protein Tco_0809140 [Tanacetum coccineum]
MRPRMPNPTIGIIILPAGDTAIDKVPTSFNQDHVDRLKAHIVKLRVYPGCVHWFPIGGLSRVWRTPMCYPFGGGFKDDLDNTVMSIHDFLCMPSLEKATVQEEPHELGTSILGRVADRTTPPAPAGTAIPRASLEEIAVTRPDPNVVAKADHAAKRKTSTGPEISTNTTKRTRLSQRVSGAGSSRTFDPSLGLDVTYPPILLPDKEVEAHAELSGSVRRTTQARSHASHGVSEDASSPTQEAMEAPDTQSLGTDACADEIASDGNVDSYFDARVSNIAGDPPPYTKDDWDEIHGVNLGLRKKELYKDPKVCRTAIDHFPTPTEIHRLHEPSSVEFSDRMSVLECQLITHGHTFHARYDHSLREVERLAKRCAQKTHIIKKQNADLKQHKESTVRASEEVSGLKAELGALKSKCEATEHKLSSWDKKHRKYRSERDTLAKEKVKIKEELKSQLEHHKRQAEEIQGSITSFFQSDFTPLVRRFLKSSEFNRAFASVLNTAISVGVERGLRMDRTDEEFRGLSQKVAGFIPDAKEKFDRVIAAFLDTTFPFLDKVSQHSQSSLQDIARLEPDRVTPSSQLSSATASLRTNTHARHSTLSSGTFGHTSTPEHLKKKKKSVERGGPSAA